MIYRILAINPGSTSTRVALFENEEQVSSRTLSHAVSELSVFKKIVEQKDFRRKILENFLTEEGIAPDSLAAIVGRGGLLRPIAGGTYLINRAMLTDLEKGVQGEHASNLGGILAAEMAAPLGIPAYIVDPVVVDELDDAARLTGLPQFQRRSIFHALNQKSVARTAALRLGKKYQEINLVVAHLGGGISIGAHRRGRVVEVNNALNGEGPITPERAGTLPAWDLIEMALSGRYSKSDLRKMLSGAGGMVAHLGTNDLREVQNRIRSGDRQAGLVFDAMIFTAAKSIGACAAVLKGDVDAVVLTGGLAHSREYVESLTEYIGFLAQVIVIPGEDEMRALAMGALRVLRGEEEAAEYS